jgi:hypothetical protein
LYQIETEDKLRYRPTKQRKEGKDKRREEKKRGKRKGEREREREERSCSGYLSVGYRVSCHQLIKLCQGGLQAQTSV